MEGNELDSVLGERSSPPAQRSQSVIIVHELDCFDAQGQGDKVKSAAAEIFVKTLLK